MVGYWYYGHSRYCSNDYFKATQLQYMNALLIQIYVNQSIRNIRVAETALNSRLPLQASPCGFLQLLDFANMPDVN
jgi:hypothetical protein